jgi:CheY-like chemotaxis protein
MPTILVIDDDGPVRSYLRKVLESAGYQVSEAADGADGLRQFQAASPDLVLCDLYMPGVEGMEAIREMARLRPGVPVIAISGGSVLGDFLPLALAWGPPTRCTSRSDRPSCSRPSHVTLPGVRGSQVAGRPARVSYPC